MAYKEKTAKNANARGYYQRNRARIRLQRAALRRANIASAILCDARRADRKKGRANDLSLESVATLIQSPCAYCGDTTLRKTLDRIDNQLGHVLSNVVPACERCNYVRRDMPYAAWLVLAIAMRTARLRGLFGSWTGAVHTREMLPSVSQSQPKPRPVHGTLRGYRCCGPPRCQLCRDAMASWKRERRKLLAHDATGVAAPLSTV